MPDTSPTPALGSTADATPYVPVSWMAVAAALAAGCFVTLLLLFGYSAAFKDRKPLIMPSLLIIAGIGLVLSFAGRRMIRNSEGTRTGENLTNTAWWVSVVGGLGYTAYLFGIEYSIQSDAKEQARLWVEQIKNGDYDRAFVKTVEPALRAKIRTDDPTEVIAANRDGYVAFSQLDLVRLAKRNPGAIEFEPKTLRDWAYRPGLIDCVFTGVVKCPEGTFPVEIPLKGTEGLIGAEGGGVRQWFIDAASRAEGLVQVKSATLTEYGWRVTELEMSGGEFGQMFIVGVRNGGESYPMLYQLMVNPTATREFWGTMPLLFRVWGNHLRVPIAATAFTPDYFAHRWEDFLRMPGWEKATDESRRKFDDFRPKFLMIWNTLGILGAGRPNGGRLTNNEKIDAYNLVTITDRAIEVRVPCEIPAMGAGSEHVAARGRVVVVCDTKEVLDELKRLRDEAKGGNQTSIPPADFRKRQFKWRVVAIESDMQDVTPPQGPGGPGGMMPPPPPGVGG